MVYFYELLETPNKDKSCCVSQLAKNFITTPTIILIKSAKIIFYSFHLRMKTHL